MSSVTDELSATLDRLDPRSAELLSRLVRDAMEVTTHGAGERGEPLPPGSLDWPSGYFEETAGAFADEPFDFPVDPPLEPVATW